MKAKRNASDRQRVQTNREIDGEWRNLQAKIRDVINHTCALAGKLVGFEDHTEAIETMRHRALAYFDGPPTRAMAVELSQAIDRLLTTAPDRPYDRAA